MGSLKIVSVAVVSLVVILLAVVGLKATAQNKSERRASTNAQGSAGGEVVRLSAPAKPASGAASTTSASVALDNAALRNDQLQTELSWAFGGKRQQGWYLYAPLICKLIGADVGASAGEFALRLSLWQKENGIQPSGMLDGDTWSRMVSTFQSQRKYDRSRPASNQLITI